MATPRPVGAQPAAGGGEQTGHDRNAAAIFDRQGQTVERARRLVKESRLHSGDIAAELAAVRASLAVSRDLLARGNADRDKYARRNAAGRTFAAVTELVEQIERAAAADHEPIDRLIMQLKAVLRSDGDPSLLIGVLVEGIAQAIRQQVPPREQRDLLAATLMLLRDRSNPAGGRMG